jgi:hypothetical protein
MKFLGGCLVQFDQVSLFVLQSEFVDFLNLFLIEAGIISVLEASLLFDVMFIT